MSQRSPDGPGPTPGGPKPKPIPRDLPDQQATTDDQPEPETPDPKKPGSRTRGSGAVGRSTPNFPEPYLEWAEQKLLPTLRYEL